MKPHNYKKINVKYQQTLDTISSIRQHIPHSFIVLIDPSPNMPSMYEETLRHRVEAFIQPVDELVLQYHNQDSVTGISLLDNLLVIKAYNSYISNLLKLHAFKNFFKVSAPFALSSRFNFTNYDNGLLLFMTDEILNSNNYSTKFYKLPVNLVHNFCQQLISIVLKKQEYLSMGYKTVEQILPIVLEMDSTVKSIDIVHIDENIDI